MKLNYFRRLENRFSIPIGIIPTSMTNTEWPIFDHFGDVGYTIGHEITHGFDKGGSQFDQDGTLTSNRFRSCHI